MAVRHKSVETKYMEERDGVLRGLRGLDRRSFLKVLGATMGAVAAKGLIPPHSFQLITLADAATDKTAGATGAEGSGHSRSPTFPTRIFTSARSTSASCARP